MSISRTCSACLGFPISHSNETQAEDMRIGSSQRSSPMRKTGSRVDRRRLQRGLLGMGRATGAPTLLVETKPETGLDDAAAQRLEAWALSLAVSSSGRRSATVPRRSAPS